MIGFPATEEFAVAHPNTPSASGPHPAHRLAALVVVAVGIVSLGFGATTMVAWHLRWATLLQVRPDSLPIRFNAALALTLTGAALIGMALGRSRLAVAAGGYDLTLGALSLVEYVAGRDLGIDQLLMRDHLAASMGAAPGRIPFDAAICWTLLGAGILGSAPWRPRRRAWWLALTGAAVTAVAVVTVFAYAAGLPGVVEWGHRPGMSMRAAYGIALPGSALMILGWIDAWETSVRAQWWSLPAGLLALIVDVFLWLALAGDGERTTDHPAALIRATAGVGLLLALGTIALIWLRQRDCAAARALRESEARYRGMVLALGEGIVVHDAEGRIVECNAAAEHILGHRRDQLIGAAPVDPGRQALREDGSPFPADAHPVVVTLRTGQPCHAVLMRIPTELPDDRWILVNTQPLTHPGDAAPYGAVSSFTDITELHRAQEQLAHRVLHDDLTGLPNRALLLEHLAGALARSERAGSAVGVLFLDLDGFKAINDSFGHGSGDEYLIRVGARIRASIRASDLAARVGGDEFVIVCENLAGPADAGVVADQVQQALAGEISVRGQPVTAGASIGIAVSHNGSTPETMLRDADAAMYVAKHRGGRRWEPADESLQAAATRVLTVEAGLRRALERRELSVYYQPLIDLRSGAIVAAEALLRWQHPQHGLILPGEFVDVAEQRGLIGEIGAWVLRTACAQASSWYRRYGEAAPSVAVNVSSRQLDDRAMCKRVSEALDASSLPPGRLTLEVTESQLLVASASSAADLAALSEHGVRIAVDDFGTGYAGFDYLRRLPVDELKIDRSYVDGTGTDPTDTALTAGVVALGLNLGLTVIAEGIQSPAQLQTLRDMGCSLGQGWLWHQALPPDELDALLADRMSAASTAR